VLGTDFTSDDEASCLPSRVVFEAIRMFFFALTTSAAQPRKDERG